MPHFKIDLLYRLVKAAIEKSDLESLLATAPASEYDYESREISERLCEGANAPSVDDLTIWLTSYWMRQFDATATDEWLRSRDFRGLAEELIAFRGAVDSPEAHIQYVQWIHASAIGYAVTNEELLLLVTDWTVKLAERLYQKWAVGAEENDSETEYQHLARSLPRLSQVAGYGEVRRAMTQEFLAACSRTDARGFLACFRGEPVAASYVDMDIGTMKAELRDCVSLYVESVLAQNALISSCDWDDLGEGSGSLTVN
jgi:hypothetical protein